MRGTQELSDRVHVGGIFERRPLIPPNGVPNYVPLPWEIGRIGGRPAKSSYGQIPLRIEVPTDMPEPPRPDGNGNDGVVKIDYSVGSKYVSQRYEF